MSIPIPAAEKPIDPFDNVSWADAEADAPSLPQSAGEDAPLNASERRLIRIGIIAAVVLVPLLLAVLILPGKFRHWSNDRAFAEVQPKVEKALREAKGEADSFNFVMASRPLNNVLDAIYEAGISDEQLQELKGKIDRARHDLKRQGEEHQRKLASGYVVKDGKLLSPDEQKEVAARVEAERQAQSATAAAESQRLLDEQRQQNIVQPRQSLTQVDSHKPQRTAAPKPDMSAGGKRHIRSLVEYVEILDKTLYGMEQGDGISYEHLVNGANALTQYAENIYLERGDFAMQSNSLMAQSLAKRLAIAAACWDTADAAAKTNPLDPSYDFKVQLAKNNLAQRDEYLNNAHRDGVAFSDSVRVMATDNGIRIAHRPKPKAPPTEAEIRETASKWRDEQIKVLPAEIKRLSEEESQTMRRMRQNGASGNSIRGAREQIQRRRAEKERLLKVMKQGDDSAALIEYHKAHGSETPR